jgi:hypothetical protein
MLKLAKANQGIRFEEKEHRYFDKNGKELLSVSKLISNYKEKFDESGEILARCAARDGIEPIELRKQWDKTRDDAALRGTHFHNQVEYFIKTGKILDESDKDIIEKFAKLEFSGELYSEVILGSSELGICGTADLIVLKDKNTFTLHDFKTNKKLDKHGFYDRNKRQYKMMLPPISHIRDGNYFAYSIQLSIYQFLMEENGYWADEVPEILYINPKSREIERHPILNLRKEAIDIIEHYKSFELL